jgi:hypothetical protein
VSLKDDQTFEEAQADLAHFIEEIDNAKRLHSALDYRPPNEFEALVTTVSEPAWELSALSTPSTESKERKERALLLLTATTLGIKIGLVLRVHPRGLCPPRARGHLPSCPLGGLGPSAMKMPKHCIHHVQRYDSSPLSFEVLVRY